MTRLIMLLPLLGCAPDKVFPEPLLEDDLRCPDSVEVNPAAAEHETVQQWMQAATGARVALDWSLVPPPPEDWSEWDWALEPEVTVREVSVPDASGASCEARIIALIQGVIAPRESALSFDLQLELTLAGDEVVGLMGMATTGDYPRDEARDAWWWQTAEDLERAPLTRAPSMRWDLKGDEMHLVMLPAEMWNSPRRVVGGTFTLQ